MIALPFLRRKRAPFPTADDFGFVELRGGGTRVKLIPTLGGKVVELDMGGRQWLWTSDVLPWGLAADGGSYVETADTGGFDECFPTVGACRVPGWVRGFGGVELPDHGELWSQVPLLEVETTPEGQCAVMTWQGKLLPFRLTRILRVAPDGAVVTTYHATNDGTERIPFIWSSHPLVPLTTETQLLLPEGAPLRVAAAHRIPLGDHRSLHRWPFVRAIGKVYDFLRPYDVAKQYACKLFLDLPSDAGYATLREGRHELQVTFDAGPVGQFGVWINKQGWTPLRGEKPYLNLAFEPCIGAPDTLTEALGDWNRAQWIEPGEVKSWTLTWRGRKLPDDEGTG